MGTALPMRLESLSADQWEVRVWTEGAMWGGASARPAATVVLGRKGVVDVFGAYSTLQSPDEVNWG
ncbi:hypothetical protein [Nocardioides jensenii]|uniref:hypothetical protein n=1 Tax=Nocardioides jensenii TaxID=1843 RepID=UPI0012F98625|nr:hypothetical protein [Nocardioides jensenii]